MKELEAFNKVIKSIEKREFKPIYFLQGDENYFIDKITEKIEATVLTEAEKGFNQSVLYGKDVEVGQLIQTARRFPMMSQYQLVILKEAQQMRNITDIHSYVQNPAPQTILVINYRSKKIDGRTKFYKDLKANAEIFTTKPIYENKIPTWISDLLRQKGFKLEPEVPMLLAETYGTNLNLIDKEVNKLALNLEKGATITAKDVEKYAGVSREFSVFEYQKALGFRQARNAFRIAAYFGRNPKSAHITMVLGNLYNYFNKVYRLHFNKAKSRKDLQKILELSFEFFVDEYQKTASNYSVFQVEKIMEILMEIDLKAKGVDAPPTSEEDLLREMTSRILAV